MALKVKVFNGFAVGSGNLVYVQPKDGSATPINPGGHSDPVELNKDDYLHTWAEKSNSSVYCSLKYRMQNSDKFVLDTDLEKSDKKWKITNPSASQTNVNVTVGDDDQ